MSDAAQNPNEYVVEYIDGPLEGRTERMVLVDGSYDERVSALVAVEGIETTLWYKAVDARTVAGEQHVRYTFDENDSDTINEDRLDGSGNIANEI
ncbi:hypothetical protein OSC27_07770 [Microbacterium sp. STN6]|uniref:hypothetical protein n=1 Tax=Microbacterium sp. STN6 TaxID=2995588 RepID=UPI002260897D|nr:hypothetical protein [Microbacterium sp. STN6]MCX7522176.1 hypothetical protein [Microbacterium sp. STN6]